MGESSESMSPLITQTDLCRVLEQLIPIEADPKHPVRVDVNGVPKFVGRPGAHHAHIAVELGGPSEERSPDR